jgi:hypothetical protein
VPVAAAAVETVLGVLVEVVVIKMVNNGGASDPRKRKGE